MNRFFPYYTFFTNFFFPCFKLWLYKANSLPVIRKKLIQIRQNML